MKKVIQIFAIILQLIAAVFYLGIIKTAIAWQNGSSDFNTLIMVVIIAGVAQTISVWLKNKYPDEVNNAEDVLYTKKELEEKKAGVNKNPLFVKILLVIPITFAALVVLWGIYTLIQVLTGKI